MHHSTSTAALRDRVDAALAVHDQRSAAIDVRKMQQLLKLLRERRNAVGDGDVGR